MTTPPLNWDTAMDTVSFWRLCLLSFTSPVTNTHFWPPAIGGQNLPTLDVTELCWYNPAWVIVLSILLYDRFTTVSLCTNTLAGDIAGCSSDRLWDPDARAFSALASLWYSPARWIFILNKCNTACLMVMCFLSHGKVLNTILCLLAY